MGITRGEVAGFTNTYARPAGGSNKMAASVDPTQYAAAVQMIRVATQNMQSQFAAYQRVFDAVG